MKSIFGSVVDILRGVVIGLANLIPGVSGGTMMVAMGIYNKILHSITNIFKEFKKSVQTLLPYLIGMILAIVVGSFALKWAFQKYPLPTNTLFIGLILGSVPTILAQIRGEKKGVPGAILFVIFFAIVIILKVIEGNGSNELGVGIVDIIKYVLLGMIASATMVIPGVSGSMVLKTLGYYEPIVTNELPAVLTALRAGDGAAIAHGIGVLLPFGIGIVLGIYFVAKLLDWLLRRYKGYTYCAVLGMVIASPVVTLMDSTLYQDVNWILILVSIVTFSLGFVIATRLSGEPEDNAA